MRFRLGKSWSIFAEIKSVCTLLFRVGYGGLTSFVVYYLELPDAEGFEIVYLLAITSTFDQGRHFAAGWWSQFLCLPLDLFVHHGLLRLIGSETHLCDFNWSWWSFVDILVKLVSKLRNINLERFPIGIKSISEVLKTRSDDVLAYGKQSVLNRGVINWMERNWARVWGLSSERLRGWLVVKNEEIL